jgi:lipoyl(octanoyl) transferase
VTTLSAEAGRAITVAEVTPVLERHLADSLGYSAWRHTQDSGILAGHGEALLASR